MEEYDGTLHWSALPHTHRQPDTYMVLAHKRKQTRYIYLSILWCATYSLLATNKFILIRAQHRSILFAVFIRIQLPWLTPSRWWANRETKWGGREAHGTYFSILTGIIRLYLSRRCRSKTIKWMKWAWKWSSFIDESKNPIVQSFVVEFLLSVASCHDQTSFSGFLCWPTPITIIATAKQHRFHASFRIRIESN